MVIMSDCHLLIDRLCGVCKSRWYDYVTMVIMSDCHLLVDRLGIELQFLFVVGPVSYQPVYLK